MDHLETLPADEIEQIKNSGWKGFCTLLPTAAFFLRLPFPPARQLLDSGCAIALASDYNPGSSPTGDMNMVVSLACIQMKLLPEEALNAATTNGHMPWIWEIPMVRLRKENWRISLLQSGSFTGISSISFWLKSY